MIPFMGFFVEENGEVHPTQSKWVWEKRKDATSGKVQEWGVERYLEKNSKPSEAFFKVFKEITRDEYNDLWGKYLELL